MTFYGDENLDLTIIASGYVRSERYCRYSDEQDREEDKQAFVISMERLAGISSHWELLLNGLVGVVDTGGIQIISLPVVSAEVFSIILSVAHELYDDVPEELELGALTLLAKASIQYSLLTVLRPWVGNWPACLGVRQGYLPRDSDEQMDFVTIYRWIWVAYAFGLPDVMSAMTFKMAYTTQWIGRPITLPPTIYGTFLAGAFLS